ncbi:UPF0746 protein DDB_G0281095-like, partial [Anopheles bellator]|uniref:UPF0746 protein DDB_G0281095-like n=1 Tax=Anopheles bellator TaxID=139047 RepID=UPI00264792D7
MNTRSKCTKPTEGESSDVDSVNDCTLAGSQQEEEEKVSELQNVKAELVALRVLLEKLTTQNAMLLEHSAKVQKEAETAKQELAQLKYQLQQKEQKQQQQQQPKKAKPPQKQQQQQPPQQRQVTNAPQQAEEIHAQLLSKFQEWTREILGIGTLRTQPPKQSQQKQHRTMAQMVTDDGIPASAEWSHVPTRAERRQAADDKKQNHQQQQQQHQQQQNRRKLNKKLVDKDGVLLDLIKVVPKPPHTVKQVCKLAWKADLNEQKFQEVRFLQGSCNIRIREAVNGSEIEAAIVKEVGEAGSVKLVQEMATVSISDIDQLAEKEDVENALHRLLGESVKLDVHMTEYPTGLQRARTVIPRRSVRMIEGTE